MTISIQNQAPVLSTSAVQTEKKEELKKLVGVLWYDILSSLNQTGISADTSGAGGGHFQSMFLWNIAENDFGGYDNKLINAALQQIGGIFEQKSILSPISSLLKNQTSNKTYEVSPVYIEALPLTDAHSLLSPELISQAKKFAKSIWPQISAAAKALGVSPVGVLAQTALETGWGSSMPGDNLFGIKAVDGQNGSMQPTHEVIDGVLTPKIANFRIYGSPSDSISDYVSLIHTLYPKAVDQSSISGFAQALQSGGYATDQNYALKIEQIAKSSIMFEVLNTVDANQTINIGETP